MNILIIIISLFLGVFTRPVFAAEINIIDVPMDGIPVGSTFPVTFEVVDLGPTTRYDFRFYGGPEGDNYSIQIYNQLTDRFLSYDDDWANMPSFYTDDSGNATVSGIAHIPADKNYCPDTQNPCYFLFVHLATAADQIGFTGYVQEIKVNPIFLIPTPTSIPTITPVPPTPTSTPIPTSIPTLIPTPTTSNSSHNQVPILTPMPTINISIFGVTTDSTASATPTLTLLESLIFNPEASSSTFIETGSNPPEVQPVFSSKKTNFIPLIIFIVSFIGLLLSILSVIFKIKLKPKCLKK